jgi:hypothetical protein
VDNIKVNLNESCVPDSVGSDKFQWHVFMNMLMNLQDL